MAAKLGSDSLTFQTQRRQRRKVRTLIPNVTHSTPWRFPLTPRARALTNTTNAPRYTRRPRNRTDCGVVRRRQPSRAQQKLRRR